MDRHKLTYVTPTHNTKYIKETYESLLKQKDDKWEWLIVLNNGAEDPGFDDDRIKVINLPFNSDKIGQIKGYAFEQVPDGIAVELDHDDLLTPEATKEIKKAFKDKTVGFVYTDFAEFKDESWEPYTFNPAYGWTYRDGEYKGKKTKIPNQFPLCPSTLGWIYFSPNHARCWRMNVYRDIGGHDTSMSVGDDHDLMCRFYLHSKMKRIPKCLYLYRHYDNNSFRVRNKEIQKVTKEVFQKYIRHIADRWCDYNDLKKVDICCGKTKPEGYIGVDFHDTINCDIACDLNGRFPFEDSTVGVIRAVDAIEHLKDPVNTMNECYRSLAHGGVLMIDVPSSDGRGAFQDPTHVSFWNSNSFWYYTKKLYADFVPSIKCRFQVQEIKTYFPTDFHKTHKIPYVSVILVAIKDGPRLPGLIEI